MISQNETWSLILVAVEELNILVEFHQEPVCNPYNWASEASPTLGCSIEISRDIYMSVGMSVVVQKA